MKAKLKCEVCGHEEIHEFFSAESIRACHMTHLKADDSLCYLPDAKGMRGYMTVSPVLD